MIKKNIKPEVVEVSENTTDPRAPAADPGEPHTPNTTRQFYGFHKPAKDINWGNDEPTMEGFLQDFAVEYKKFQKERNQKVQKSDILQFMQCYGEYLAPVLNGLAKQYAVCDEWFSSVPSQTWPNRLFAHFATSFGIVQNDNNDEDFVDILKIFFHNKDAAFFEAIEKHNSKFDWKIYAHGTNLSKVFLCHLGKVPNIHTIQQFICDAKEGNLPSYSFIEPRYEPVFEHQYHPHNDQHPSTFAKYFDKRPTIWEAETLMLQIYEALFVNGKNPDKILLIITYDEHGGCYDHIPPPKAVPPEKFTHDLGNSFKFNRFGARVPCVLISPWIDKNTVLRSDIDQKFCHSSISKSLCEKWGVTTRTERDKAAPHFWKVLNSEKPRQDATEILKLLQQNLSTIKNKFDKMFQPLTVTEIKKMEVPHITKSIQKALKVVNFVQEKKEVLDATQKNKEKSDPFNKPNPEDIKESISSIITQFKDELLYELKEKDQDQCCLLN